MLPTLRQTEGDALTNCKAWRRGLCGMSSARMEGVSCCGPISLIRTVNAQALTPACEDSNDLADCFPLLTGGMLYACAGRRQTDRVHVVPFLLPVANPLSDIVGGEGPGKQ